MCKSRKVKSSKRTDKDTLGKKVVGIWRYIVMLLESSKMKYRVARSVGYQSMEERRMEDC